MSGYLAISGFIYRIVKCSIQMFGIMETHAWSSLNCSSVFHIRQACRGTVPCSCVISHYEWLKRIEGRVSGAFVFFTHLRKLCYILAVEPYILLLFYISYPPLLPQLLFCFCAEKTFLNNWTTKSNPVFSNVPTFLFYPQSDSLTLIEFGCSKKCSCCRNNFFASCFWNMHIWWKNENLFNRLYRDGIIWNVIRLDFFSPNIVQVRELYRYDL